MKILLIAALGCFVVALICACSPTTILDATYVPWMIGGFVAIVLSWLVGGYVDTAWTQRRPPPQ
jgi:hypothetical protein